MGSAGVLVRHYRSMDEPFVARLAGEAFAEFARRPGPLTLAMLRAGSTLVAERDGHPVGFAVAYFTDAPAAHLSAIAVEYQHRGVGVGSALLLAAEGLARRHGAQRLELCTADSNLEALDLFLKRGFRIEKRLANYYGRGQAACLLTHDL